MKELKFEQKFDYSLESVLKLREYRYKNPKDYKGIAKVSIESETKEGTKTHFIRKIKISNLPDFIPKNISSQLTFILEESTFDNANNTHTLELKPAEKLSKFFSLKSSSSYISLDENTCKRNYEVEIESKVFLLSSVIETAIAEYYTKSIEEDYKTLNKTLSESSS